MYACIHDVYIHVSSTYTYMQIHTYVDRYYLTLAYARRLYTVGYWIFGGEPPLRHQNFLYPTISRWSKSIIA